MKKQKLVNEWIQGCDCDDPSPGLGTQGEVWDDVLHNLNFRSNGLCQGTSSRHIPFDVGSEVKVTVHLEKRVNLMVSILNQNSLLPLPQRTLRDSFLFLHWMDLSCSLKGLNIPIIAKWHPLASTPNQFLLCYLFLRGQQFCNLGILPHSVGVLGHIVDGDKRKNSARCLVFKSFHIFYIVNALH